LPGLRILRHREDRHGREPAAAIAMRGRKTLLIDLARQANGSISFPDHGAIDRSMFDGIADPACELAQIIQPAPTLQNLFVAPAKDRPRQTRIEIGESSTRTSD